MNETFTTGEPPSRSERLTQWLLECRAHGDQISVEQLRQQMAHINEHYNRISGGNNASSNS